MTINRKPTRYAHADGHTDVCYSEDGQRLITCGTDGDIRIWNGFNDDDPVQACVGEWSLCVCHKQNQLYIGTDNNSVQLMTFPDGERDGILIRFTAHVNHMAVGKEHDFIAIAAEDMEVKVMKLSDPKESSNILSYSGLSGPPLSVALSPKAKLLAVSSGDGYLRIWDVESTSLLKTLECVPKTNSFMNANLLCRIDFDPISGRSLAYPNGHTVIMVNTFDWSNRCTLICSKMESPISIVRFSPCGSLMAAASQKGDIVVWDTITQNVIDITTHSRSVAICAMVWNPLGNGEIAYCDVQGQLGIMENCASKPAAEPIVEDNVEDSELVSFKEFCFEDDEENNEISLEKLKNDILKEDRFSPFDGESSRPTTPRAIIPEVPLQSVFMPTSTPLHLSPRYLCWNEVGVMRCYGSPEDDNVDSNKSIEVEFHDATLHNSMMLKNFHDYTMGSLSTTIVVVANTSQITVIPLNGLIKEWNLNAPEEDEIICIASSAHLVCFATAAYLIRAYSAYGTQKAVLSVPGPVVSMSAYNYFLLVAYHNGAPRKGDQCISMMFIKLETMSIESKDIHSALRPETTLQWLGFTDLGTPAMQDSFGLLSLYPISANAWLPFCDTTKYRKNPSDGFFITAVSESGESVRGIRCRGSIYPSFTPRPALSELPIEPPFFEMGTEKSQLEAKLFTWSALRIESVEKKFKETALKTFALACKNNIDQRALEFIEMMANPQLLTLATKYATKMHKNRLAQKLVELASSLQDEDGDDTNLSQSVIATPTTSAIKPINRKFLISSSSKRTPTSKIPNDQLSTVETGNSDISTTEPEPSSSHSDRLVQSNISLLQNTSLADTTINTQESDLLSAEPKNPFLKSLKKVKPTNNPLSLTDKFAGYSVEEEKKTEKENRSSATNGNTEKRKKPDTSTDDTQKVNKQRKLDMFMFSKRS